MALVLAPEPPAESWLAALDAQLAQTPGFFDGKPVIVDLALLPQTQPDVAGLIAALQARGVRVVGIEGARRDWPGLEAWGGPLETKGARTGRPVALPPQAPPRPDPVVSGMLIDRPVRSGQTVSCPSGDLTILGAVASGAEIVAAGSIHVYGPLRGRAIAGSAGQADARIFCARLEAELLVINGSYTTAEDIDPALRGRAAQAWLDGEAMLIAALDG